MKRHDEIITLKLAAKGTLGKEGKDMGLNFQALADAGWHLENAEQPMLEWAWAVLGDEATARVRSEWYADPKFLIDLKYATGICPLCGHQGLRWLFKIRNRETGAEIECGSECIITHGLHVDGAATSAEARKLLDRTIRRRIRELEIEAWMAETGWFPGCFDFAREAIASLPYGVATALTRKLESLEKFYHRWGWIGSPVRWRTWCGVVAVLKSEGLGAELPEPVKYSSKKKTLAAPASVVSGEAPMAPVAAPVVVPAVVEAPLVVSVGELTSGQLALPGMGEYTNE